MDRSKVADAVTVELELLGTATTAEVDPHLPVLILPVNDTIDVPPVMARVSFPRLLFNLLCMEPDAMA